MKKIMICGLLLVACAGIAPIARADEPKDGMFPDVPKSHWAYAAVADLKARGILTGYPAESPAAKSSGRQKMAGKTKPAAKRRGGLKNR